MNVPCVLVFDLKRSFMAQPHFSGPAKPRVLTLTLIFREVKQLMRYLSLGVFITAMYMSWSLIESPAAVPEATHILIQEDLKRIITEKIQEDLPNAASIQFDRFWTENVKGQRVRASFVVSFDLIEDGEETVRHGIQGQYLLTFDSNTNQWSGDGKFEYTQITFKKGIVIQPSTNE